MLKTARIESLKFLAYLLILFGITLSFFLLFFNNKAEAIPPFEYNEVELVIRLNPESRAGNQTTVEASRSRNLGPNVYQNITGGSYSGPASDFNRYNNYSFSFNQSQNTYTATVHMPTAAGGQNYCTGTNSTYNMLNIQVSGNASANQTIRLCDELTGNGLSDVGIDTTPTPSLQISINAAAGSGAGQPNGSVTGRLILPDGGTAPAGFILEIINRETGEIIPENYGDLATNDDGRFILSGLPPGEYMIGVGGSLAGSATNFCVGEDCWSFPPINFQIEAGEATDLGGITLVSEDEEPPSCEQQIGGIFSWAFCGFFRIIDSAFGSLYNVVESMLIVQDNEFSGPEIRQAWGYFRNIATLALVVIGLVMIIGQAVSKE